jgi:hypothetical protein
VGDQSAGGGGKAPDSTGHARRRGHGRG